MKTASTVVFIALVVLLTPFSTGFAAADTTEEIVAKSKPAVVFIRHRGSDGKMSTGTGFVITSDGHIATCAHVLSDDKDSMTSVSSVAEKTWVRVMGESSYEARIVYTDSYIDFAVLKIDASTPLKFLPLSDSNPAQGEELLVIGYPLGDVLGKEVVVTKGIVSAIRAEGAVLQLDAAMNPGNSGGPILTKSGSVAGIAWAQIPRYEGTNFALSATKIPSLFRLSKTSGGTEDVAPGKVVVYGKETLRGFKGVYPLVDDVTEETRSLGLRTEDIQSLVERRLRSAGITINSRNDYDNDQRVPLLRVSGHLSAAGGTYYCRVSVKFYQTARVGPDFRTTLISVATWDAFDYYQPFRVRDTTKATSLLDLLTQPAPTPGIREVDTTAASTSLDVIGRKVDEFSNDFLSVNTK